MASSAQASSTLVVNRESLIEITGEIGFVESGMAQTIEELSSKNNEPIYMSINSPGGSILFGMMIVDAMEMAKLRGVQFRCLVGAVAASMAFQILAHCDKRYALSNANLLFHSVAAAGIQRLTPDEASYLANQLKFADKRLDADLLKT